MRYTIRNITPDLLIVVVLFVLPLMLFWAQTVGGKTLIPAENLYQYEPYATYREVVNAPEIPHNHLVSDLVLQNFQWKAFIKQSLAAGEVPLWNPHQFAGIPFMAAGQPSTLYPLNAIYYALPLVWAYGWFTVVNLWLAGVMMFAFLRGLHLLRSAALIGAITYQLAGFFVASAVFPMMLGAVVWLPLLLLMVEYILRARPAFGRAAVVPWVVVGAGALGVNVLAGHVEITYYTILITAYYGLFRLGYGLRRRAPGAVRAGLRKLMQLAAMGALGLALGAVQFVPLFELVNTNWRATGKTYAETVAFAHPARDVLLFAMPRFYGSPAQHDYRDVFTRQRVPLDFTNPDGFRKTNSEWGIKNYVEGVVYVGVLPLVLALYALVDAWGRRRTPPPDEDAQAEAPLIFGVLAGLSLTFMFGLPTYALLYYGLPGLNQSHTPFRWIYAFTFSVAVLAALGMERLMHISPVRPKQAFMVGLFALGGGLLAALGVSYALYTPLEPTFERVFHALALADRAFPDVRAFYSHIFANVLGFALLLLLSGFVFWLWIRTVHRRRQHTKFTARMDFYGGRRGLWAYLRPGWADVALMTSVMVVAMDLIAAHHDFNPASDPALLDFTPPVVAWMQTQPGGWRYITLDDPVQRPILPANVTWRYGLDDVRGYESIIPKQYVDTMRGLYPQVQLDFNRIAPLYTSYAHAPGYEGFDYRTALTDERLHRLNVRYVVTHRTTDISDVNGYALVYEDEAVRVWENANAGARAFVEIPPESEAALVPVEAQCIAPLQPGRWALCGGIAHHAPTRADAEVIRDTGREMLIRLPADAAPGATLVVSQAYFPGWRAYAQTPGGEVALPVRSTDGGVFAIDITTAADAVRFVYSPTSFQVGFFASAISAITGAFLLGVWLWRRFVVGADDDGRALLARNSAAPVILNLFNRGINFVFAFVMLRILGPADAGIYYYAVIVFVWFDIFTNFGLDVFLTREVSRDKARGAHLLLNTTAFRLLLSVIGFGLLLAFLFARQNLVAETFDARGVVALLLLYAGLIPSSLSKGMTSLYYAHERAEYPAAVSTVTTISTAVLGVAALLAGFGIIGLAAVSIFNNFVTLAILVTGGRDMFRAGVPAAPERERRLQPAFIGQMARESYPLMLNHFLATIFFQIDVVILEALRGAAIVGKYSVAYRWLLALNVIPAFFTLALFPRLSRQAEENRDALRRSTVLSLKLLAGLVFPAAVLLTFLARPLTLLLGGQEYLPEGALALQIMVWSMPLGWMNSLTQYVLIAVNRQRQITWAFAVGVTFNIVTNLLFIPVYGFRAAAVTTIASEAILLVGFALLLQREMPGVPWLNVLGKPGAAGAVMAGAMALAWGLHPAAGVMVGAVAYPLVWWLLRPLSAEETGLLAPLLPGRVRRWVLARA